MLTNVYFERSNGQLVSVGVVASDSDERSDPMQLIRHFCEQHQYQIPYMRMWNAEMNGKTMTCVDVGSHTEFFWIDPPLTSFT